MPAIFTPQTASKKRLIDDLLQNRLTYNGLVALRQQVDANDLSYIIQRIYDLNEKQVTDLAALDRIMRLFNDNKNSKRNSRFTKKIGNNFRDAGKPGNKIVLAEGDSWFNYPVILTDVLDAVAMDPRVALYSLAQGGDWLLNMLTGRKYVEELSVLHPDFFIISGGGNDIVGARRVAAIIDPTPGTAPLPNDFVSHLIAKADKAEAGGQRTIKRNPIAFNNGIRYLSKDFYSLLMFFHLQFFTLINGILNGGRSGSSKFPNIKIITQGYDYPIPSSNKKFGFNIGKWYIPFIRIFLGHGSWLKRPMQLRGINDPTVQRHIVYAMIYLFNEMAIDIGDCFNTPGNNRVFHIDSRDSVGEEGWTDELHAKPQHFINTGRVFTYCLHHQDQGGTPTYDHVFEVKDILNKLP